jgi:hypothetical protein
MSRPAPLWMRPGWLPTLERVEWERLDCLREEHERLLLAHIRPAAPRLRRRFSREDQQALDAERAAVGSGGEVEAAEVTPPLRRRALLESAEEADARSLRALCAHVKRAVDEILGNEEEMREAIAAARRRTGLATVDDVDRSRELPVEARYGDGPVEESRTLGLAQPRRVIAADLRTLQGLVMDTLSADGMNVLDEIERACPGITNGLASPELVAATAVGGSVR